MICEERTHILPHWEYLFHVEGISFVSKFETKITE